MDFATYLQKNLYERDITPHRFVSLLKGSKISKSSFYYYVSGEVVPTYEKAHKIVEILNDDISDDELVDILNQSIPSKRFSPKLEGSFKIYYQKLSNEEGVEEILNQRIAETSTGMNDYLTKLIKKDLQERVLEKGKDYE